jgi:serine phosphatase RsbU (regulator of sigma subunit)/AmiR/NasT family two-component response regulator
MANETVLVVEDEVLVGMELKEDLERLGYQVPDVVPSGEHVVEAMAKHQPDLVLMDVRLDGGVDGIEAAYQARAEFEVPIIYVTAYSDGETLRRAAITEPSAFLLKPFDERELAANVEIALTRSRGGEMLRRDLRQSIPLLRVIDTASILADAEGRIVYVNQAAARALGANDAGRLRGLELGRFVRSGSKDRETCAVRALDGGTLPLHALVRRLDRPDGRFMGNYVTLDTMDRKERLVLEHSAKEANDAVARGLPRADSAGPGFRVGGFLNPCPSGTGDCFDVFRVDERSVAFYGLDVMGHGILSSLVAFSLHDLIPVLASGRGNPAPSPDEVVRDLNARFKDIGERRAAPFFTIAYGVLDSYTGKFSVVRAGHSPVLLLPAKGDAKFLETSGAAIGIYDELTVETAYGVLGSGDRLLVASDGLLDSFDEDDGHSAMRSLAAFAESRRGLGIDKFAEELYALDEERRSARVLCDDSSLLVIERF